MRDLHRSCLTLSLSLLLALFALPIGATRIEEIPNPRPAGWVTDLTGTLTPATVTELNHLGDEVLVRNGAHLEVVVIGSTDGESSNAFATRLFNTWGIGERGKNNGLLVFAALEDHAAEIVLGDGLDSTQGFKLSDEIMQGEMVPRFRAGDPDGAILQGARACAERILNVAAPVPVPVVPVPVPASPEAQPQPLSTSAPDSSDGYALYGWLGALVVVVGIGLWFSNRPVRCKRCKEKMVLLGEPEDDAYLESHERFEEKIGSVNYAIWRCPSCGEIERNRHNRFVSSYETCPKCSAKTLSLTTTTLCDPTESSNGLVRVDCECAYCSFQDSYERSTPRLARRSTYYEDSDDGRRSGAAAVTLLSSGSSFDSSSSSSWSSSSDSGGGGHSSGGGASGHW